MSKTNKVVLAFSGGLDTSFCAIHLAKELKLEVHAVMVNTGGFSDAELQAIANHAQKLGVSSFKSLDKSQEYYEKIIKYLIWGNVLKNNTYPLSVSAERIIQAIAVAEYAKEMSADYIAHGSTGAGNDQVRFDLAIQILAPEIEILTPIRDLKLSREQEITYLQKNGIEMNFEKAAYSINKGLWGTSVGGKETLTSNLPLPNEAFPTQLEETSSKKITLRFAKGELTGINGETFADRVKAINTLQQLCDPFAIGRDIHVGDTIIGIKGRVGFEAAAPLLIIKAHHLLEKHTLTKWQLFMKDQMSAWYGTWLHDGQYLEPAMRDMEQFFESSQTFVTGDVFAELTPGNFKLLGIESEHDLMSSKFGSYGEMNNTWTGEDVKGFTKIVANQTSLYFQINNPKSND